MADRFYQLSYPADGQPVWLEDLGNVLNISGMLLQGKGVNILCLAPNAVPVLKMEIVQPSVEEWGAILRQSDDPVFFERDEQLNIKAVHRKVRFAVSGAVQQQMWVRDGLACMYCGRNMGDVQLTIDHFVPLELGGANDQSNYLSACRACQKDKGNRHPLEWCNDKGLDYTGLVVYLAGKCSRAFIAHLS